VTTASAVLLGVDGGGGGGFLTHDEKSCLVLEEGSEVLRVGVACWIADLERKGVGWSWKGGK